MRMQSFTLCSSKIEVSKLFFFDIVTTQNDRPTHLKHVVGSIYVFFHLIWRLGARGGGGGSPKGLVHNPLCSFSSLVAQKSKFLNLLF